MVNSSNKLEENINVLAHYMAMALVIVVLQFWSLFEQIIPNREQRWKKYSYPLLPTIAYFT